VLHTALIVVTVSLGELEKQREKRNPAICFVMSFSLPVLPSGRKEQLGSQWAHFH
jgi:hypothetical protein